MKGALEGALDVGLGGGIAHEQPKDAPRPPLFLLRPALPNYGAQAGRIWGDADPGLKPWAVLYSRLAAKSYFPGPNRQFSGSGNGLSGGCGARFFGDVAEQVGVNIQAYIRDVINMFSGD